MNNVAAQFERQLADKLTAHGASGSNEYPWTYEY